MSGETLLEPGINSQPTSQDDSDDDENVVHKGSTQADPRKKTSANADSKQLTLGQSVQAGISELAHAMIEVAKITAPTTAVDKSDNRQMIRIEHLLEQQTIMNAKMLQALERMSNKL